MNRVPVDYCNGHMPFEKQMLFCAVDDLEVMFGGAAGGGKSDALLMAGLMYHDQPHYRSLILRRRGTDLVKSGAILDRANSWFSRMSGCHWRGGEKKWIFPSGATMQFGSMNNEIDKHSFDGSEFHYIGFDELGEFTPTQYLWMFSRLRKIMDDPIPLRMRGATNPGGVSHHFLRDRFMTMEYARAFLAGECEPAEVRDIRHHTSTGKLIKSKRWFIPSKVRDNKALDADAYEASLSELDAVDRARLMSGDWLIMSNGRFKPEWFNNRYRHPDEYPLLEGKYELWKNGKPWKTFDPNKCTRFMTIDPAGTAKERSAEERGRSEPSWSVINTWDLTREHGFLILRDVVRVQEEFPEVMHLIKQTWNKQAKKNGRKPQIYIERDGIGKPYYQLLAKEGVPVQALKTEGRDKLQRSVAASQDAEAGRIWLPDTIPWLDNLEAELFVWTGLDGEVADQIDTMSYASILKADGRVGAVVIAGGSILA